jgi:hypothetical protein
MTDERVLKLRVEVVVMDQCKVHGAYCRRIMRAIEKI